MTICICSRAEALELAENAKEKTAVISITSPEEEKVVFPANPNVGPVLHLKCSDLTEEYDEEGIPYGRPLPKQEDFEGLRKFVIRLSCDCLVIHCWEGRSRSSAVAMAVYEFLGCRDILQTGRKPEPNPLVYELACRELGIRPGDIL